jgi:gas vesicle protein
MQNKNNNINSGIGGGFLLGFILGVLATLLLTTKKGREILRDLLDKGIQKITDIEEALEKAKAKPKKVEDGENDYVKSEAQNPPVGGQEKQVNEKGGKQEITTSSEAPEIKPKRTKISRRLFFRKSKKKSL